MENFRGGNQKAKSNTDNHFFQTVIGETIKLWRKHHLSYEQTKYVVEMVRKEMQLKEKKRKANVVHRLSLEEAQKLIDTAYNGKGKYGLLLKTLFLTGARVAELVHIRVEDIFFQENEILITHGKGDKKTWTIHIVR